MKCLMKYQWVKLPRNHLPEGKGILGQWAKLASRAAFRKGIASYCGHSNAVDPGTWSGGIVGIKSILGLKSRQKALEVLEQLDRLGYIQYDMDKRTKKLDYQITDWVVKCSGAACMEGTVYATDGYGFLCLPRNITERLVKQHYMFEEADAWLDLWCHSVWSDPNNAFSFLAPAVQYGVIEASADGGNTMWYNSAYYDEPDAPHTIMQSANGVDWYAMQQHADAPAFESGDAAFAYNQAQFQAFMPGYEQQVSAVDGSDRMDGHFEVRHKNGSGTMFYDTAQYAAPRGDYQVYEDVNGGQWYAIHGDAAVERRPVFQDGKPVYDGDSVKTVSAETVRYRNTPSRYGEPKPRSDTGNKPPRRKR